MRSETEFVAFDRAGAAVVEESATASSLAEPNIRTNEAGERDFASVGVAQTSAELWYFSSRTRAR